MDETSRATSSTAIHDKNTLESAKKTNLISLPIQLKPSILYENFRCGICDGYIIDANTINDCFHSFCKSCIVQYIRTSQSENLNCPTCNLPLNKEDSILPDPTLQRLIYKLVPNLLTAELERREKFYSTSTHIELIFNNSTTLNLKLVNKSIKNLNNSQRSKENVYNSGVGGVKNKKQIENEELNARYIQCPAGMPIRVIAKLIRNKYNVPLNYKIKLTYNGHVLEENETLLEVYTSFILDKSELLEIKYELIKHKVKSFKSIENNLINKEENKQVENIKKQDDDNLKESEDKRESREPLEPISNDLPACTDLISINQESTVSNELSASVIDQNMSLIQKTTTLTTTTVETTTSKLVNTSYLKLKFPKVPLKSQKTKKPFDIDNLAKSSQSERSLQVVTTLPPTIQTNLSISSSPSAFNQITKISKHSFSKTIKKQPTSKTLTINKSIIKNTFTQLPQNILNAPSIMSPLMTKFRPIRKKEETHFINNQLKPKEGLLAIEAPKPESLEKDKQSLTVTDNNNLVYKDDDEDDDDSNHDNLVIVEENSNTEKQTDINSNEQDSSLSKNETHIAQNKEKSSDILTQEDKTQTTEESNINNELPLDLTVQKKNTS